MTKEKVLLQGTITLLNILLKTILSPPVNFFIIIKKQKKDSIRRGGGENREKNELNITTTKNIQFWCKNISYAIFVLVGPGLLIFDGSYLSKVV